VQLIGFALTVSIFLGVLAVGMRVVPGDLHYFLGRPQLVRFLLAMNVLVPIIAVMVCRTFSLHGAVIVAPEFLKAESILNDRGARPATPENANVSDLASTLSRLTCVTRHITIVTGD
jgi:hypothetical protein